MGICRRLFSGGGVSSSSDLARYVWKKSEVTQPEISITNPSITFTNSSSYPTEIPFTANNFDLNQISSIWLSFFGGFTSGDVVLSTGSVRLNYTYGSSWTKYLTALAVNSASSGVFTMSEQFYVPSGATLTYSGKKIIQAMQTSAICFVTSDDSSEYPNGAVHTDGYYYELVNSL